MALTKTLVFYANPTIAELENGVFKCKDQSAMGITWCVGVTKAVVDGKEKLRVTVRGTKLDNSKNNNNNNNTTSSWRAVIQPKLSIYNKTDKFVTKESPRQDFDGSTSSIADFDWAVIHSPNQSVINGRLCLHIWLIEIECIFNTAVNTRKRKMCYSTESPITDFALVVEGQKVYVGRQFLATHSKYFNTLFYGDFAEKEKNEIELKDVIYEDFIVLMDHLYPTNQQLEDSSVEGVLALADQFEVNIVLTQVESYLLNSSTILLPKKLLLSDRYGLVALKNDCIRKLSDKEAVRRLTKSAEYKELSSDLKVTLLEVLV